MNIENGGRAERRGQQPTLTTLAETHPALPIWKNVVLGGLKDGVDYCVALRKAGCRISEWAEAVLSRPTFRVSKERLTTHLVKVTVLELGFDVGARLGDICAKAKKSNLLLCPPEVGPALALVYEDQIAPDEFIVATKPLVDSHGRMGLFCIEAKGKKLSLQGELAHPDSFWQPYIKFVFTREQ